MFTYVKLKNFLSFGDTEFNFKQTATTAKKLVAIYGENGSGKSNFVKSFDFLYHTVKSFSQEKQAERISEVLGELESKESKSIDILHEILRYTSPEQYLTSCRTVNCDEPTELEFGFIFDGHEGFYKIAFSQKIVSESLYGFTGKQRNYLFRISSDESEKITCKFWSGLFPNKKFADEIRDEIQKYWGKHSFLGIITRQIGEKNDRYIGENISKHLLDILFLFLPNITVINKSNTFSPSVIGEKPESILDDMESGTIEQTKLPVLERTEHILKLFFTQTYADIKDVVYETEKISDNKLRYRLYVDKMIAGKIRRISFQNESAGTRQVLKVVRMLLGLFSGATVIYDEIDNGIHDILLCNIIRSLQGEINGQLIITTHNTMLLEEIDPKSAYVISVDYMGNKEVSCMADFAIQSNNNVRIKYLKGLFGGTPYVDGIDYDAMISELEATKEES